MPELVVEGVTKSHPGPDGPLDILKAATLTLRGGESASLVGPSGSGKSTLLHLLGGLDHPTAGRVTLDGVDPHRLPPAALARFRNRQVGFVFQDHHLLPQCTVRENVLVPALAGEGVTPTVAEAADRLIARVGLTARAGHRPAQLSGGERQRAALARALLLAPPLLLCDEPTGNLDPASARSVAELLGELGRDPAVILFLVTHSPELAGRTARQFALRDGVVVELAAGGADG